MRPFLLLIASLGVFALLADGSAEAQQSRRERSEARPNWTRPDWSQSDRSGRNSDVYVAGRNMGTDPDPRIRFQIQRDIGAAVGGDD
jgi:hypothetical protein